MKKPLVAVGSLGGTIAMTSEADRGVTPTLSAEQLLVGVPGLDSVAMLEVVTLATLPSASLSPHDIFGALSWAREAVEGGASGVVLVQGTDTLEETAYLMDLFWDRSEPLVVTGAMRSPERAGSDGPSNLLASVSTAVHPRFRDLGVLVVMNDEIHAAARVSKHDSTAVEAFHSPVFGPLGRLVEEQPVYVNRPLRQPYLSIPDDAAGLGKGDPRVALITSHLDDSGDLLRLVADAGYDGVVLAALGVGHVSTAVADAVDKATEQSIVVFATRTGAGSTAQRTYGFVGSETDLICRGAMPAGWLSPVKARLLLWALLRVGKTWNQISAEFSRRGGNLCGQELCGQDMR